jgi:hypothetical protein
VYCLHDKVLTSGLQVSSKVVAAYFKQLQLPCNVQLAVFVDGQLQVGWLLVGQYCACFLGWLMYWCIWAAAAAARCLIEQ